MIMEKRRMINGFHCSDVKMGTIGSQITSLTIVYSTVYSDADQRKHQSSSSLAFVRGIHRRPVNSPHKWPGMRKMFPFDDVIMLWRVINLDRCLCDHVTILTTLLHYDVRQWKRVPRCRPFVRGIHRSQVETFHKGPVTLMFSLILA